MGILRVPLEVQVEIEQFLGYEARLLEENRLDEWLDLLADDCSYVMPVNESVLTPAAPGESSPGFALFDDDKASLRLRAGRIQSGLAPTEVPPALVQRLVTNVHVEPGSSAGEYRVRSNFLVHLERRGRHVSMFVGRRNDVLRRAGDGWRIASREIRLAQTLLPATIPIFF